MHSGQIACTGKESLPAGILDYIWQNPIDLGINAYKLFLNFLFHQTWNDSPPAELDSVPICFPIPLMFQYADYTCLKPWTKGVPLWQKKVLSVNSPQSSATMSKATVAAWAMTKRPLWVRRFWGSRGFLRSGNLGWDWHKSISVNYNKEVNSWESNKNITTLASPNEEKLARII